MQQLVYLIMGVTVYPRFPALFPCPSRLRNDLYCV